MNVLYAIGSMVLSNLFFSMLFNKFNMSKLDSVVHFQKSTSLKKRKLYSNFLYIIVLGFIVINKDLSNTNYIIYGIVYGFLISLIDIIFATKNKI